MAKKAKRKDLSAAAGKKALLQARLDNPFEARQNKKGKHDVLNRKVKGGSRNVALSRSLAYEKRKRTLLTEFQQSTKANTFLDKRFGEKDKNMTEEERILERFKRLRQKRNLYNLSDTDAAGAAAAKRQRIELTHLGQSLSSNGGDALSKEMQEFERMMRDQGLEEEDLEEQIDAKELMERIKDAGDNQARSKSKKEVMEEVIAKAKIFKMHRQQEKEADEDERDRLDEAFRDLMKGGAFQMRPTKKERQAEEMQAIMDKLSKKGGDGGELPAGVNEKTLDKLADAQDEDDEYERTVRSLFFEARAAATDRTRTPEEEAKRDLEKLEQQQRELERRMKGILSDDEDDDAGPAGKKRASKKRARSKTAKDAFFDEADNAQAGLEAASEDGLSEGSSSGSEDDSDSESEGAGESKPPPEARKPKASVDDRAEAIRLAKGQLPFVIEAPDSLAGLYEILDGYEDADFAQVVLRVRKSNSIHLKAENRGKMRAFLELLIEHLIIVVEQRAARGESGGGDGEVEACITALYDVAHDIPDAAAQVFVNRLERMQATLGAHLGTAAASGADGGGDYGCDVTEMRRAGDLRLKKRGGHKGAKGRERAAAQDASEKEEMAALDSGVETSRARCWPSPGDLAFFRAVEAIFPVTDFQHPVVSPAQLLLGQYLAQCPIRGPRDVVACLCTCQLLLDFVSGAKRLAPEAILALEALALQAFVCPVLPLGSAPVAAASRWVLPQILLAGRDGQGVSQLEWLRRGVHGVLFEASAEKDDATVASALPLSLLSYGAQQAAPDLPMCDKIVRLLCSQAQECALCLQDLPSGDVLLQGLVGALASAGGRAGNALQTKRKASVAESVAAKAVREAADQLRASTEHCVKARRPMRLLDIVAKPVKAIEPLYNEHYKWTKDGHDADKQRVEMKKLKKQVKRERKGVARELRKDAQFLSEQRQTQKQSRVDELRAERQANFNWVTQQAGDIDKAVREFGARGGGSSRADMRGRRRASAK